MEGWLFPEGGATELRFQERMRKHVPVRRTPQAKVPRVGKRIAHAF